VWVEVTTHSHMVYMSEGIEGPEIINLTEGYMSEGIEGRDIQSH